MVYKNKKQYRTNNNTYKSYNKKTLSTKSYKSKPKIAKVAIVTGGTGGHIFPAQVLSQCLHSKNYSVDIILDKRAELYHKTWDRGTKVYYIKSKGFSKNILKILMMVIMLTIGFFQSCMIFFKSKPKCLVSFGGYMSIPAVMAAIIFRIPIIQHEQNSYLGKSHKLFVSYTKILALTFANTLNIPKKAKKVEVTGLPIRLPFYLYRNKYKEQNKKFTVAILGGSLGANIFGTNIVDSFAKFSKEEQENMFIYHQVRKENLKDVQKAWGKTNITVQTQNFFQNVPEILWQSDLIVSRSGASTVKEIELLGKFAVYIPFAKAADNHQLLNAQNAKDSNSADIILESEFTSDLLFTKIQEVFLNQDVYYNKSINIKNNSTINATEHLIKLINTTIK